VTPLSQPPVYRSARRNRKPITAARLGLDRHSSTLALHRERISTRACDSWCPVHLDTSFTNDLGEPLEPYERLLHDALIGDPNLFAREDSIEQTWRIVQPLLDEPAPVRGYRRGSWGPTEADALLRGHQRWQPPWLAARS
jgi:glucose-6-phosphate 1-dehydrogenase